MERIHVFFDSIDSWVFHLSEPQDGGQNSPLYIVVVQEREGTGVAGFMRSRFVLTAVQEDISTGHVLWVQIPVSQYDIPSPDTAEQERARRQADWVWKRLIAEVNMKGNFDIRNATVALPRDVRRLSASVPEEWAAEMREEFGDGDHEAEEG